MEIFFEGKKYNYKIINEEFDNNEFCWTLRATCKETKRYSGINNLNSILSRLFDGGYDMEVEKGRFEDSFAWDVSEEERDRFNEIVICFLNNAKYLIYLEDKLDEDRSQGEWANVDL